MARRDSLQKRLEKLAGRREMAFILALAERGYPNYALFARLAEPAWEQRVRAVLVAGWRLLAGGKHDVDVYKELTRLEPCIPDPEAFEMYGARPAADMAELLEQAFLTQVNPDRRRAPDAATRALGTVTDFVEMSEGEGMTDNQLVALFDAHELVKLERAFQREALDLARRLPADDPRAVEELRELAANRGVSNLGLDPDQGDAPE